MSWNYSGDPRTSDKDAVRFHIQDTNQDEQLMEDEEILYLLEREGDVLLSASRAALALASRFASEANSITIGDYSEKRARADQYLLLAERLAKASEGQSHLQAIAYAGGISRSDKRSREKDSDRVKPSFKRGLTDHASEGLGYERFF